MIAPRIFHGSLISCVLLVFFWKLSVTSLYAGFGLLFSAELVLTLSLVLSRVVFSHGQHLADEHPLSATVCCVRVCQVLSRRFLGLLSARFAAARTCELLYVSSLGMVAVAETASWQRWSGAMCLVGACGPLKPTNQSGGRCWEQAVLGNDLAGGLRDEEGGKGRA